MRKILSQITQEISTSNRNPSKLIVSIHGDIEEIRDQMNALKSIPYDLLEICPISLDILSLKKKSKKPWILTYKRKENQTLQEYIAELQQLLTLSPDYIDIDHVDFETVTKALNYPEKCPGKWEGKWIISYHDFSPTSYSADALEYLYAKLSSKNASFVKIALSPISTPKALQLFFKAKEIYEKEEKLFFVCMGERVSWTRILASKWNVGATYSCIDKHSRFGQVPIHELVNTYSFFNINKKTKVYALLGDPVDLSLSHITHNQIFKELGLGALYCKIPLTEEELTPFLTKAKIHFSGFSITRPLKSAIIPGEIINTIFEEHLHLSFANTDTLSCVQLIKEKNLSPKSIVILGTGSTAKGIASACIREGWNNIVLLSRNPPVVPMKGATLLDYTTWTNFAEEIPDLVINTTPFDASLPDKMVQKLFSSSPVFFELNYNPSPTKLVKKALKNECPIIWGIELFALQAAFQMAFWFPLTQDVQEKIRYRILEICTPLLSLDPKLATSIEKFPGQIYETTSAN